MSLHRTDPERFIAEFFTGFNEDVVHSSGARMRKGATITTEVYFFGRFSPDGRLAEAHQLTRALPAS